MVKVVDADPGEVARGILPQVGVLVFGDLEDDEVGVGGVQRTQLRDKGRRPLTSVGGEADEDGCALSDFRCQGAHLPLLVAQTDFGEGDDFDRGCCGGRVGGSSTLTRSCHSDGAQGSLLQQWGVGCRGVEGIVGRGYGSEGTVIPGGIEGEVRPSTIALEEGEVRSSSLGIAVNVLAGEGVLQLRGEGVDTC